MALMFNALLLSVGLQPSDVRLLRHKDTRAAKGRTPYELWRDSRPQFELYQSTQGVGNASKLKAQFWASFVGTPSEDTLFVGIYAVRNVKLLDTSLVSWLLTGDRVSVPGSNARISRTSG